MQIRIRNDGRIVTLIKKKVISLANLLVNAIADIKTVAHMICHVAFLSPRGVVDLKYFLVNELYCCHLIDLLNI